MARLPWLPRLLQRFYFSVIIASRMGGRGRRARRRLNILSDHLYLMKSHKDTRGGGAFCMRSGRKHIGIN